MPDIVPPFTFYKKNFITDSATMTATSANASLIKNLYDRKPSTVLSSTTSNDTTPEVWEITPYDCTCPIDTIFIHNHNIKSGSVDYWNGSAWVSFSTPATWSANASSMTVFKFTGVAIKKLRITMNTTIVANAQKYIGEVYMLQTLGTPSVPPSTVAGPVNIEGVIHKTATGGFYRAVRGMKKRLKLTFSDATPADVALFETLSMSIDSFIIWPSGGVYLGQDMGYRLQDIYEVGWAGDFETSPKGMMLKVGESIQLDLMET